MGKKHPQNLWNGVEPPSPPYGKCPQLCDFFYVDRLPYDGCAGCGYGNKSYGKSTCPWRQDYSHEAQTLGLTSKSAEKSKSMSAEKLVLGENETVRRVLPKMVQKSTNVRTGLQPTSKIRGLVPPMIRSSLSN